MPKIPLWAIAGAAPKLLNDFVVSPMGAMYGLYQGIKDDQRDQQDRIGAMERLKAYDYAMAPEDYDMVDRDANYAVQNPETEIGLRKYAAGLKTRAGAKGAARVIIDAYKKNPNTTLNEIQSQLDDEQYLGLLEYAGGKMDDMTRANLLQVKANEEEKTLAADREASYRLGEIYPEKAQQFGKLAELARQTGASPAWVGKQADDLRTYAKPNKDFATIDAGDKTIIRYFDGRPDEAIKKGVNPNVVFKINNAQSTAAPGTDIEQLAQSIANGNLDPSAISKRGNLQAKVFARVNELSPGFNFNQAMANAKFARSDNINRSLKLLDSIDPMLDELEKAHKDLGLTKYPAMNKAKLFYLEQTGDPRTTAFQNLRNNIVLETTNAMQGSSQMSDARVKMEAENLEKAQSPAQMRAAIRNIKKVIGARTEAFGSNPFPRSKAGQNNQPQGGSGQPRFKILKVQ